MTANEMKTFFNEDILPLVQGCVGLVLIVLAGVGVITLSVLAWVFA